MSHAYVYQTAGRLTRMPERGFQPIPPEGAEIFIDTYYRKALDDGDIFVINEPEPVDTSPAEPTSSIDDNNEVVDTAEAANKAAPSGERQNRPQYGSGKSRRY